MEGPSRATKEMCKGTLGQSGPGCCSLGCQRGGQEVGRATPAMLEYVYPSFKRQTMFEPLMDGATSQSGSGLCEFRTCPETESLLKDKLCVQ